MRVVMVGVGSRGDAQPMAVFGAELAARGHEVVLGLASDLVWVGRAFGLPTVDFNISARQFLESPDGRRWLAAGDHRQYVQWLLEYKASIADQLQADLIRLGAEADVLVTGGATETEAAVVTEASGVPLVCVHHAPVRANSAFPNLLVSTDVLSAEQNLETHAQVEQAGWQSIGPYVNALRSKLGLPPTAESTAKRVARAGGPELQAYSRFVVPELEGWDSRRPLTGFLTLTAGQRALLGEAGIDPELDRWLDDAEAPVYFGFGSMPVLDEQATLNLIGNVSRTLGVRALVSAGWSEVSPGTTDDAWVRVVGAVDHEVVLPRCRIAVHHGGAGTTAASLRAGVPTVVCSVFADQPFWGAQLQRLGVGTTLRFAGLTESALVAAIEPLLDDAPRQRAAALAADLATENGAVRSADAFEKAFAG